jgi:hypothetical protein
MKTLLLGLAVVAAGGCYSSRELQAEMVRTELIRIDTINRYSTIPQKQLLTWRDSYNLEYTTIVPMEETYIVGTKMIMLRPR